MIRSILSFLFSVVAFSGLTAQICGNIELPELTHLIKVPKATKANPSKVISIYLETDLFTRNQLGSDAATEAWLQELFLLLAQNYAKEEISTSLTGTFWPSNTSQDWSSGYSNSNIYEGLNEFGRLRQNTPTGRMKQFVTMKGAQQGLAWIDVLQANYFTFTDSDNILRHAGPYAVSFGLFASHTNWNKIVLTHEMGHNMGSWHTNRCIWGNGTQVLDMCNGVEPISNTNDCSSATLSPNAQDDTMMSNCNQANFVSTGFGVEPGNLIRAKVDNAVIDLTGGHCAKLTYIADNIAGNYYATEDVIFHPGLDSDGMCVFIGCP